MLANVLEEAVSLSFSVLTHFVLLVIIIDAVECDTLNAVVIRLILRSSFVLPLVAGTPLVIHMFVEPLNRTVVASGDANIQFRQCVSPW